MLPLPLLATSPVVLGAILFVFGATNGAMDVAMNAHGVAVERELPKPIMSSLHGGWSLGGFAAAGLVAVAGAAGVDPRLESLLVGIALWLAALWITSRLGSASAHSEARSGFALPSRPVMLLGGLCFLVMMTEGAIADWSGIYLRDDAGRAPLRLRSASRASRSGWRSRASAATCSTSGSAPGGCCAAAWRSWRSRSACGC